MPLTEKIVNGFEFWADPTGEIVQVRFDPTTAIELDADAFMKFVRDLNECARQLQGYRLSQQSRN